MDGGEGGANISIDEIFFKQYKVTSFYQGFIISV